MNLNGLLNCRQRFPSPRWQLLASKFIISLRSPSEFLQKNVFRSESIRFPTISAVPASMPNRESFQRRERTVSFPETSATSLPAV